MALVRVCVGRGPTGQTLVIKLLMDPRLLPGLQASPHPEDGYLFGSLNPTEITQQFLLIYRQYRGRPRIALITLKFSQHASCKPHELAH